MVALAGCNLSEDHPTTANYYSNLANIQSQLGNYDKAIDLLHKTVRIDTLNYGSDHPSLAITYHNLAIIHYVMGNYDKSLDFFSKVLAIRKQNSNENPILLAYAYNNLGSVYQELGDYNKVVTLHEKALEIIREQLGKKHPNLIPIYDNLATVYYELNNHHKALDLFLKAMSIRIDELGLEHADIAISYGKVAMVYRALGHNDRAIECLEAALRMFNEDYSYVIKFDNHKIKLPFAPRKKTRKDSEGVSENYGKLPLLIVNYELAANRHHNLAFTKKNYYDKIKEYQEKKVEIEIGDSGLQRITYFTKNSFSKTEPNIAGFCSNLSVIYAESGNYKKALELQQRALKIWTKLFDEHHRNVIRTNYNIALLHEALNDIENAQSIWKQIIPSSIKRLNDFYLFLPEKERLDYLKTLELIYDRFYAFTAKYGDNRTKQLAINFLLNTKSLALDYAKSTNQLIQEINDATLSTQHQQLNKLNKQLADAETLTIEEREEKGWDVAEIREEQEALAFQILQHPQLKLKLNTETIEWQDVQNSLASDEATIDFLQVYEREDSLWTYYAVVIRDTQSPHFVRVTDEKTLNKLLEEDEQKRLRFLYDSKTRKALHKTLWQPLKSYLEDVKTVHISPSGALHRVPFECFQDETDEYLAAQYAFHYHAAIRDMLKEKPQQNTYEDMLVMGHILYDLDNKTKYQKEEDAITMRDAERNIRDGIRPLPETLREVKKIGRTAKKAGLKTTLLTIDAASEDTLQYFVGERAPGIMHFATHGVFLPPLDEEVFDLTGSRDRLRAADNPLQRSALMLYGANETWIKGRRILGSGEDGILTALEVTALDLQNTNLVVLSACSTGLGNVHNTEGVFGLQRAFKLAGVDYVVASLWAVDDTATKELMVLFYENLLRKKQDPATALRNAKEKLRKDGYLSKYWAGFILIE